MQEPIIETLRHAPAFMKTVAASVIVAFLGLTLEPLALAANAPTPTAPAARPIPVAAPPSHEEQLGHTLETLEDRLDQLDKKLTQKERTDQEQNELKALRQELEVQDMQAPEDFSKIEKHLQDKNLPKVILDRHTAMVKTYKAEMATLKTNLDEMEKAKDDHERKVKAKQARDHLKAKQAKRAHVPLDPKNLPTRVLKPNKANQPKVRQQDFVAAGLYDNPTVKLAALGDFTFDKLAGASDPAYLAPTPEVVLSDAIKAKALELNYDPVKIYQFVRNSVEWIPSWSSIQGANLTLQNLRGNAIDTASLLIALLRASGIPARYVHGTIDVPTDKFTDWAGGFTDVNSAWEFASSGGLPVSAITGAGKIAGFRMEHVWVEAAIDYFPSRGAINKSADTWVQLDASFKQHATTPGLDVTRAAPFKANDYLSQIRSENPVQYYQQKVQDYLDINAPDKTLGEAMGFSFIKFEEHEGLPSGLPYKVLLAANRYGRLPAGLAMTVNLQLTSATGQLLNALSFATPDIAGKRLTLSYAPASAGDEALVASYGGDMYAVPPYLLYVKPVLKIEGVPVYTGEGIPMGEGQLLAIAYQGPTLYASAMPHKLIAGGYYAVVLNLQGVNTSVLGDKNHRLIDTLTTQTAQTAATDDLIGEHLYALGLTYFFINDQSYRGAAKLYHVATTRAVSAGLVAFVPTVRYFFGLPHSVSINRAQFDVGLEATQASSKEGNPAKRQAYLEINGLTGSFSENAVFEQIHGFDSVSAVKAIQASAQQGVPILHIDATNAAQLIPQLQVDAEDRQEIQNGIAVGLIAIVPQHAITINDWSGTGYILKDPQTSAGVYRVSGGLSGGSSTKNADGWQIVSLFKGAFAWIRDKLDVIIRAYIAEAATAEWAGGEKIAETAQELAATNPGYENVNQCSGLVRRAYWSAGICLDNLAGSSGCPDNLVQRYRIPGRNGVLYHYNLANALKQNNSVRKTNDPLIGDIVFFSNTSGPGNPLNHEGIVVVGPDAQGMIKLIDATRSAGVSQKKMNLLNKNDPATNSFLGSFCVKGTGDPACLVGNLFDGYGTIRDPNSLK